MQIENMDSHHAVLDPEGYVYCVIVGESNVKSATQVTDDVARIVGSDQTKKYDVLVNLLDAGTSSAGAVKVFGTLMKHPQINRLAIAGGNDMTRVFVDLAKKFAGLSNLKMFDSLEQAQQWLKN